MTDENLVIPFLGTSLMAVLAFDDAGGQALSKQLLTRHFDTMHQEVARELLRFHKQYKHAPKGHFYELFSTQLAHNDDKAKLLKQVLESIEYAAKDLNVAFVIEKVNTFLRKQRVKVAFDKFAGIWETAKSGGDETYLDDIEKVAAELTRPLNNPRETGVMSIEEFVELDLPAPEMLLSPWLEAGTVTMVHSPPGHGKTLFLMHVAMHLSAGFGCFQNKWQAKRPVRILYVDGELPPNRLLRRLNRFNTVSTGRHELSILSTRQARAEGIEYPSFFKPEGRAMLNAAIEKCRAEVIIFDSIFTLFGIVSPEKDAEKWLEVDEWLKQHGDQNRSFILVHHDTKGSSGNAYGTVVKNVVIDTEISLARSNVVGRPGEGAIEVKYPKTREFGAEDAETFVVFFAVEENRYRWRWEPKEYTPKETTKTAQVRTMLMAGKTTDEIIEALEVSKSLVSQERGKLREAGHLRPEGTTTN